MAKKGEHDGKSGRSDNKPGDERQRERDANNSRTASKQNAGHGGHS